jgi:pyruvate,water dikinase
MAFEFARFSHEHGIPAAYGFPVRVLLRRINTYLYQAVVPAAVSPDEARAQETRADEALRATVARLGDAWATEWLPEVKAHLAYWERLDLAHASVPELLAHLDETIARAKRLWEVHFLVALAFLLALSEFDDLYRELFGATGGTGGLDAYRLLQGFDNKSLEGDRALWRLSRKALASEQVREVLATCATTDVVARLDESPAGQSFLAELRAYLAEYGRRGDTVYDLSFPSWMEDPSPVIVNLRDHLTRPDRDPHAELQALAAERRRLVAAARERLRGHAQPVVERFERALKAAQEATVLTEDHNYWIDFPLAYHARRLLLEFGRRFAAAGVTETPDDVFYLTLEELRQSAGAWPASINRRLVVVARRAELAYYRTITPPPSLGTKPPGPPPDGPLQRAFAKHFGAPPQAMDSPHVVRGTAGASGTARGPARVLRSLAEASKLRPGDVLVAETTTPPWTPLFATAAAVVTDTGGVLSHCATVAREYGIPAVVGTGNATVLILDGQDLEVDGSTGIVRIVPPT